MEWVVKATPRPLYFRERDWMGPRAGLDRRGKRPATHCIGDWMGPRAGLDRCGIFAPPGFLFSVLHLYYVFVLIVLAVQHTQHKHLCPWRDSNPQSQQAIGRRPLP